MTLQYHDAVMSDYDTIIIIIIIIIISSSIAHIQCSVRFTQLQVGVTEKMGVRSTALALH